MIVWGGTATSVAYAVGAALGLLAATAALLWKYAYMLIAPSLAVTSLEPDWQDRQGWRTATPAGQVTARPK